MNVFNTAITELQTLMLIKQENQQTLRALNIQRKKMYQPISMLALIPQVIIDQDPIIHLGGDYFAQLPIINAIEKINMKIKLVNDQIEKLKFQYFPQDYLSPQQYNQIIQEINKCLSNELPGYLINQGIKQINIVEKAGQSTVNKTQKISKFAIQHNLK
ncbi:Prefoldin subunit-containing protein [Spironucleus salmonicida]|uniref:Prefoldin subunit-containing protein n=1 Tax=Spironucleus salmonicida TaxID=348837 RepID=V6LHB4_9EUKA|nr:Prefoldin subunit-containing protein [Spironucleus salmonicida]|eukprot:EST43937.1 Prefoldin subunit-containing protein [Spironucleus salmonicida]